MAERKEVFPLIKTKVDGLDQRFDLSDPGQREEYFEKKVGPEIAKLKEYLRDNTFIAYWLGKKNSGKGTYSKLMTEIFGEDKIGHISVGDIVRSIHGIMADEGKKKELMEYLQKNYRGYISLDDAVGALLNRDTKSLLPTEFILTLVKKEIDKMPRKTLFIDGFPREIDQISYSLYFRDLINHREDPDVFIAINIPESVIDERMKYRVVCPNCHTPRNLKLLATKGIEYDEDTSKYYLLCDNPECGKVRMVAKEGDELGIETIRDRLELDEKLIQQIIALHGVPKVLLRNALPADLAEQYVDNYELTPEYVFKYNKETRTVDVSEKPWTIKDDEGRDSYSLLAPAVIISLIKQLVVALGL